MLCKCHWIVLYTVYFTAFCLGGPFFPGHGVYHKLVHKLKAYLSSDDQLRLNTVSFQTHSPQPCMLVHI